MSSVNESMNVFCWLILVNYNYLDRVKRIWYLSPMRAVKVQASLRIRAVSPEPSLLAHTSSESKGTFRQKTRSLAPLNGWACAVKICHDGMLEDTNSLDASHFIAVSFLILQPLHPLSNDFIVWIPATTSHVYSSVERGDVYPCWDETRIEAAIATCGMDLDLSGLTVNDDVSDMYGVTPQMCR